MRARRAFGSCTHTSCRRTPRRARCCGVRRSASRSPRSARIRSVSARFESRPAVESDRRALAGLFAAVAEARDGIASEPPVDVAARAAAWRLDGEFVAEARDGLVGQLHVDRTSHGYGEIGMLVARDWRGRGVGSALMAAAIDWARAEGLHKLSLAVFAHNEAGLALYRKFGFIEEGRRVKQFRRQSGELWDAIDMGLLL